MMFLAKYAGAHTYVILLSLAALSTMAMGISMEHTSTSCDLDECATSPPLVKFAVVACIGLVAGGVLSVSNPLAYALRATL
jgi:hypothetical protein